MKKIIACISLVFAMSAGVTALAAEEATYTKDGNSVSGFDANTYSTVLITEDRIDDVDDIVYVNQEDSGLAGITQFLIKDGAKEGNYKMKFGGATNGEVKEYTFKISSEPVEKIQATIMGREESTNDKGEAVYAVGCKATVTLDNAKYVVITAVKDDKTESVTYSTGWSGEGVANIGIKVTDVPADVELTVGLSNVAN